MSALTVTGFAEVDCTTTLAVVLHPLTSVMVRLYVPPDKFDKEEVLPLLLHKYVNGELPDVGVAVAAPLFKPQVVFVEETFALKALVAFTITEPVAEHPPKSVTVIV